MKILLIILALLAAFIVITLIRAAFFKAKRVKPEVFEEELVHSDRVQKKLSEAIKIKTITLDNDDDTDCCQFDRIHTFLREAFPLVDENLSVEDV